MEFALERIVEQTFLYDFYGELLTEHQKGIYEEVVLNDFSLSEVAQEHGISRQSVYDMIKRCDKILTGYEEKLHLVEKFLRTQEMVTEINRLAVQFKAEGDMRKIEQIQEISQEIMREF
ncbi:MAG: DNA-binding protein [Lachnospiraceae bacterium]|nr:DNA-binding protein [Lachnospiraceae bacterium]